MREAPKVGQTLFSLNVGNAARRRPSVLTPVTVSKVGRKFFTVTTNGKFETAYHLDDWREKTDFLPDSKLYLSEREYEEEREEGEICQELWKAFESGGNHLGVRIETLRELRSLLNPSTETPRSEPRIDSEKTSPSGRVETAESASDASQGRTGGKNESPWTL